MSKPKRPCSREYKSEAVKLLTRQGISSGETGTISHALSPLPNSQHPELLMEAKPITACGFLHRWCNNPQAQFGKGFSSSRHGLFRRAFSQRENCCIFGARFELVYIPSVCSGGLAMTELPNVFAPLMASLAPRLATLGLGASDVEVADRRRNWMCARVQPQHVERLGFGIENSPNKKGEWSFSVVCGIRIP